VYRMADTINFSFIKRPTYPFFARPKQQSAAWSVLR
jgi:hypothetical protein